MRADFTLSILPYLTAALAIVAILVVLAQQ